MSQKRKSFAPIVLVVVPAVLAASLLLGAKSSRIAAVQTVPPSAYADVQALFADPPAEYRSSPLWVWNDRVTKAQINDQLADFKAKGIGGVFIHPRPGLITPYLSPEWMDLFRHAVSVGRTLGMKIWIYDENSYPSGFAGGHVPALMPDAARTGLRMRKYPAQPASFDSEPLVIVRKTATGFEDISSRVRTETFDSPEYYVFDLIPQKPSPWYGGYTYVDIMRPEVTAKFLEVTLDAYKREFGADFGGVVPGTFQDEAEINPAGGSGMAVINWTPRLFTAFQAKRGYDLRQHLPALFEEWGDWARVRHDYYATLLELFIEGWAKPYYDYCQKNALALTGHYWEHEWPRPTISPDNLAMAAWSHMPGIDILMNDWQPDTHGQFGNARAVKEIRSSANQLGRARTMSETYGASGWDLTFFDQKRIADWEYALGVNFMNQHLSYVTIMGARKRDHPLSFSYHEPWWGTYKTMADYIGRLSVALSSGRQDNGILVLEPTTTAWMVHAPGGDTPKIAALGKAFQDFVNALEKAQVEYDLGSEDTIRTHGKTQGGRFIVGRQSYDLVILPPALENLESSTLKLLETYLADGGRVLCADAPPKFVDGRIDAQPAQLAAKSADRWTTAPAGEMAVRIYGLHPPALAFSWGEKGAPEMVFHHRRTLQGGELVFLANVSPSAVAAGEFTAAAKSCERWDLFDGRLTAYPSEDAGGRIKIKFELPPGGSLLLGLRPDASAAPAAPRPASWAEVPSGATSIVREGENVLTLDYCDLVLGGKTERDLYFYDAQTKIFQAHGLERNPWDSAVQYKTNILDRDRFPAESGFEARFRFRVDADAVQSTMAAVVERPDLFEVRFNNKLLRPVINEWWLDKAFGVFPLGGVTDGWNTLTVKSSPFTINSELEPVYIVGDFLLRAQDKDWIITSAKPLKLGAWSSQGLPFYGHRMAYVKSFDLPPGSPADARYAIQLGRWQGASALVRVNGEPVGNVAFAPFRFDITPWLKPGRNEISVVVCGTLKNTLGPFHNDPPLGRAWPGSFQQGAKEGRPQAQIYSVVGYGLLEDFKIVRSGA